MILICTWFCYTTLLKGQLTLWVGISQGVLTILPRLVEVGTVVLNI